MTWRPTILALLLLVAPAAASAATAATPASAEAVVPPSGVRPSDSPHHPFGTVPPLSDRGCHVPQGERLSGHSSPTPTSSTPTSPTPSSPTPSSPTPSFPTPSSSTPTSPTPSTPAWPVVRGPFSWADRVMNSTTIARSGGLYKLREQTQRLFTPSLDVASFHFEPYLTVPPVPDQGVPSFSTEIDGMPINTDFFSYALGSQLYGDAAALLFTPVVFAESDTLQYLRGVLAYDIHDFPLASSCFAAIPEGSPYASQAGAFLDVWNSTPEVPGAKSRSPFLAAAMSAVIPGSGKIYAGDLRSGVSTLLIVGALGGMAAESWIKLGGRDWRTIALSSVFGLFYIGNIYGSAVSVSVIKNSNQDAQKAILLFNLRVPLHRF